MNRSTTVPSFSSAALHGQPPPDWADVVLEPVPPGVDPPGGSAGWANAVFAQRSLPAAVRALLGLRQTFARLIGVPTADASTVFVVQELVGEEALVVSEDRHLDFRCGVALDTERRMLRVTTAVWLYGWRGRLYFLPVRLLHDPVTRSMMRRAVQRATRGTMTG